MKSLQALMVAMALAVGMSNMALAAEKKDDHKQQPKDDHKGDHKDDKHKDDHKEKK